MVFFHFDFLLYNPSRRKKTENLLDRIISLDLQNYDLLQGQTVFFGNYAGINVWLKSGGGGGGGYKGVQLYVRHFWGRIPKPWDWKKFEKYPFLRLEKLQFEATFVVKIPRERAKEVFKPGPLSVQPKISEIFLRNQQMERTISVRSDRNIWEHL